MGASGGAGTFSGWARHLMKREKILPLHQKCDVILSRPGESMRSFATNVLNIFSNKQIFKI